MCVEPVRWLPPDASRSSACRRSSSKSSTRSSRWWATTRERNSDNTLWSNPRILQSQTERVLPGQVLAHLVGRLPVGQVRRLLQHGDQRQAARGPSGLARFPERLRKRSFRKQLAQAIAHLYRQRGLPPAPVDTAGAEGSARL